MATPSRAKSAELFHRVLALWGSSQPLEAPPTQLAEEVLEITETLILAHDLDAVDRATWHDYLDATSRPRFLLSLPSREHRYRWAETTFAIIRHSGFRLLDMFTSRVASFPERPLFQEIAGREIRTWSYARIARTIRSIGAAFVFAQAEEPRVAILANNSVDSACSDLACLFYGIFVTPLNVHFDGNTLVSIFDRLKINIVVADTDESRQRLAAIRSRVQIPFRIFVIGDGNEQVRKDELLLRATMAQLGAEEAEGVLASRPGTSPDETATVMFTSGSTGAAKGIAFSEFALISKRFARGAALPQVGQSEVFVCYLPLYHTFGRYLELLGSIYWGGTYVFAGNPSVETLVAALRKIQPTGLIGIPFRWVQLRDFCLEKMGQAVSAGQQEAIFRRIVGDRLYWGLSAAGYLDPKVFHFFHRHGVDLLSGFGMTEATGGITMTPPGEYFDDSVGIALPGVVTRFGESGELQVSGPYVARYLDEPDQTDKDGRYWLATGDLFKVWPNGHYEIVDRIKDIYKNSKGQTVAPRRVEQRFTDVPGIKTTFLVGDGRAYNVLLIVPDRSDPVLADSSPETVLEYFHQIITAANQDLAPYERVVNFALLDREFNIERDELTSKGSFRRRVIEEHFAPVIRELYRKPEIELPLPDLRVRIPRWFFRDLGILEDDIVLADGGLLNRRHNRFLRLSREPDSGWTRIGDLEYEAEDSAIDLGLLARQPRLWIGNPELVRFCPCREGWDLPVKSISVQLLLPWELTREPRDVEDDPFPFVHSNRVKRVHSLSSQALFGSGDISKEAVKQLSTLLAESDDRIAGVIQRRLEALARHPDVRVRSAAYRTLLLDQPIQDYSEVFPAFIQSGLPFLDEESIEAIARSQFEQRRLEALRQRLHGYRTQLSWPSSEVVREQFRDLLRLLVNFARYHSEAFSAVREELAAWILHRSDPELSAFAESQFDEMAQWCRNQLNMDAARAVNWPEKVVFEEALSPGEVQMLRKTLFGTTLLQQSVMLIFDEPNFDLKEVPAGGVWVTRVVSTHQYLRYRITVNTDSGKHFDIHLILREDLDNQIVRETTFRMIAIGGYAYGPPVLPRFGCSRPDLGAMTVAYITDLTVWERIREFTTTRPHRSASASVANWRKLFIRAIATVFRAWHHSDCTIVPGVITPSNVIVPEPDFRQGSTVLSLTGWTCYVNTISMIRPIIRNFYDYTFAHSPWTRDSLDLRWIFDGCVEALGVEKGREFLARLDRELARDQAESYTTGLRGTLREYRQRLEEEYHLPMAVECAIDRFKEWEAATPQPTAQAREQTIDELYKLYRIDRFAEIARYHLYRQTYFSAADPAVREAWDSLLNEMFYRPGTLPTQMPELSDLQAALTSSEDRAVFSRMVFPASSPEQRIEVLSIGESDRRHVIVRSEIVDKHGGEYSVRAPLEPAEIGQLYRLLFKADFPKVVSQQDHYLVCLDREAQIIGGVCYRHQDEEVVHLDGVVVTPALMGRGIGTALLEDFFSRMAAENVRVVKTHFFLRRFCLPRGFQVDRRWGGLVRFLAPPEGTAAAGS